MYKYWAAVNLIREMVQYVSMGFIGIANFQGVVLNILTT